ncbi:MAG: MarR family winged helix-turn-helix transcriptional regulator [Panacagrimonas sp.]
MATLNNKTKAPFKAGFLIHDASRLRRTVFDQRLKGMGITRSQWWVLSNLGRGEGEGFSQIELARLLDVGKVTLGGLVDRLEGNGLVVRVPDKEDRRSKRVQMSRKGKALLTKLAAIAIDINHEIMQGITAEEEEQLIEILTKMKRNLKVMDAVPASTVGRKTSDEE